MAEPSAVPGPASSPVTAPDAGLAYHQIHRAGARGWWRPLVGVLSLAALMFVAGAVVLFLVAFGHLVALAATGHPDPFDGFEATATLEPLTPLGLTALALSLAVLIPLALGAQRLLHGLRPGTLTSVLPRMRWGYFFACTGLSVVALLATLVVGALIPADTAGEVSGSVEPFTTTTAWFLVVIVLLIPFQAAGEEYAFRGYLTQAFGGVFPTWVAIVAPALIFALAHGAQDPPIFFDRFAFGVVAGILVVRTGGLEAAIAMHILNNWFAFTIALVLGQMDDVLTPTAGSWASLPVTLTQSLVYLGLALWMAKVMGLQTRSGGAVLVATRVPV